MSTSLEETELMILLEDPINKEGILQLLEHDMEKPVSELEMSDQVASSILEAIMHAQSSRVLPQEEKVKYGHRIGWRIAAAAVIVTVLSIGFYGWFHLSGGREVVAANTSMNNDVSPGGDKAILTLADGKKIVLDSAANGLITLQGNVKIIKRSNGELSYSYSEEKSGEVLYNMMSTPRGGQYMLTLPDSSRVWLNATSSIRYPTSFIGSIRQVEISGEVYFEVAKNTLMPFVVKVHAGKTGRSGMEIKVLGTHFNVMAYADEPAVTTTLLEGKVSLSNGGAQAQLHPGQQATLAAGAGNFEVKDADVDEAVAWTTGFFQFENMNIYTIMRQLSRWYDVEISYEGKDYGRLFGGRISRNLNLSAVLSVLEANNIHFKIEGKKIIVLP